MTKENNRWLTLAEVAALEKIPVSTLLYRLRVLDFPVVHVGRRVLIRAEDYKKILKKHRQLQQKMEINRAILKDINTKIRRLKQKLLHVKKNASNL